MEAHVYTCTKKTMPLHNFSKPRPSKPFPVQPWPSRNLEGATICMVAEKRLTDTRALPLHDKVASRQSHIDLLFGNPNRTVSFLVDDENTPTRFSQWWQNFLRTWRITVCHASLCEPTPLTKLWAKYKKVGRQHVHSKCVVVCEKGQKPAKCGCGNGCKRNPWWKYTENIRIYVST